MALPIYLAVVMSLKPVQELFVFPPKIYVIDPTLSNFSTMFRICWQIVMPNQKPALMTVVIFSFQAAWNIQGGTLVFDESLAYGGTTGGVRRSHARRCHDGGGGIHAHSANRDLYAGTAAGHRNHGVFGHQGLRKGVRTLAEQEKMTVDRLFCAAGGIGAWYERFCFGTL